MMTMPRQRRRHRHPSDRCRALQADPALRAELAELCRRNRRRRAQTTNEIRLRDE